MAERPNAPDCKSGDRKVFGGSNPPPSTMLENQTNIKESFEKTRSWLEKELENRTTVSDNVEKVIFVGLTNRTNTGALSTALGRSPTDPPITRHMQPFKAIARQIMESWGVEASTPLTFFKDTIELGSGIHLIKETVGPNIKNPAEWIDAMKILHSKGLSADKLVFVPTFRDPFDTISSWKRMWGWDLNNFPFDSLNKSLQFVSGKIDFAKSQGIKVVPSVNEFIRDFGSEEIIKRMCHLIDIPFSSDMITWENSHQPAIDIIDPYKAGNLVKYDQPPNKWIEGALAIVHGGRGGLEWRPVDPEWQLSEEEKEIVSIHIKPAIEIHNHFENEARSILGLM